MSHEEHKNADFLDLATWWEDHYSHSDGIWSGQVNSTLAEIVSDLRPGSALDLGCGEGGDALWLAGQGWSTRGVDISHTAVARARKAADAANLPDSAVQFEAGDLSYWSTGSSFDLVTASFLQSWPIVMPRTEILRRATNYVAPGGHLLVLAHASGPQNVARNTSLTETIAHEAGPVDSSRPDSAAHRFPTPDADLQALALNPDQWDVRLCEIRERYSLFQEKETLFLDSVLLVQRHQA